MVTNKPERKQPSLFDMKGPWTTTLKKDLIFGFLDKLFEGKISCKSSSRTKDGKGMKMQ